MDLTKLQGVFTEEPKYRFKQANEAIFQHFISNWSEASVFSLPLRDKLNKECPIDIKAGFLSSEDEKVTKAKIFLDDGLKVETVLMRHGGERNTVCVSSAVGCPLGCVFCATGKMGFKRNLEAIEIIAQVLFFARLLKKEGERVTNVVFMGMGEPFLNYDNVIRAIRILNDSEGLNIGSRHISVSTVGIIDGINKFSSEDFQVNLAISLHAPNNILRARLMPVSFEYPLEQVLTAVDAYIKKTNRQVMFEYILIKDVNDSEDNAAELSKLMKKPLYFLNLILYNAIGLPGLKPSPSDKVRRFKMVLEKNHVKFSQRFRFGGQIQGACGQLGGEDDSKN